MSFLIMKTLFNGLIVETYIYTFGKISEDCIMVIYHYLNFLF